MVTQPGGGGEAPKPQQQPQEPDKQPKSLRKRIGQAVSQNELNRQAPVLPATEAQESATDGTTSNAKSFKDFARRRPGQSQELLVLLATGKLSREVIKRQVTLLTNESHDEKGNVTDPKKAALAIDLQMSVLQMELEEWSAQKEIAKQHGSVAGLKRAESELAELIATAEQLGKKRVAPELPQENQIINLATACGFSAATIAKNPLGAIHAALTEAVADPKKRSELIQTLRKSDAFKDDSNMQTELDYLEKHLSIEKTNQRIEKIAGQVPKVVAMGGLLMLLFAYVSSQKEKAARHGGGMG